MADHPRTELISDALGNAVAARDPDPGVVFHNRRRRHSALHWQTPIEFETTAINRAPAPQIAVQVTGS